MLWYLMRCQSHYWKIWSTPHFESALSLISPRFVNIHASLKVNQLYRECA